MEDKTTADLKRQHEKRKRINRMKMGLVSSIFIWMLISLILGITLLVKVFSLEKQIDVLTEKAVYTKQVEQQSYTNAADMPGTELVGRERVAAQEDTQTAVPVVAEQTANLTETDEDKRKVYLTFDDGPSTNTQAILDILDQYQVKATFFVTGKEDEELKPMYQAIVDAGHTIGMHSYSHRYSQIYESLDGFQEDFSKIQSYVYDLTGVNCVYYRFPGGSSNQVSNTDMSELIRYLNEQNITYFDWNVSSGDATSQAYTADELVDNVLNDVVKYKTSVVLMHDSDTKSTTVEALEPMIQALQELGADILPIDENTTVVQHIQADSVK